MTRGIIKSPKNIVSPSELIILYHVQKIRVFEMSRSIMFKTGIIPLILSPLTVSSLFIFLETLRAHRSVNANLFYFKYFSK